MNEYTRALAVATVAGDHERIQAETANCDDCIVHQWMEEVDEEE